MSPTSISAPSSHEVRQAFRQGRWAPGKIAPAPLPEEIAKLPGDYVTRDIQDDTRVHAENLDPDYIQEEIIEKRRAAEVAGTPDMSEGEALKEAGNDDLYRHTRLSQKLIDIVRYKIIKTALHNAIIDLQTRPTKMPEFPVRHLWFKENDILCRELRMGNPPSDSDRPAFLRGMDLVVDPLNWPKSVVAELARVGYTVPDLKAIWEEIKERRSAEGLDTEPLIKIARY